MEMVEDLVKAGNPGYVGLMAWVVPLSSDTCTQVRTQCALASLFLPPLLSRLWSPSNGLYSPLPPSPPLFVDVLLFARGGVGEEKKFLFHLPNRWLCA